MKNGTSFARRPVSWRLAAACVALSGMALPVWSLDLTQAYRAASENDASIRAARAAAEAGRERLPQAVAQQRPNVSLNAARNHNDLTSRTQNLLGQPVTNQNQYYSGSQTLSVRQPLYRPYLSALVRQAQAQVEDADATLERDEHALVTRVAEAYFDVLLAGDQQALVAAQKKNYAVQLDAARKGFMAGSGTRTDVDEAQARLDLTLAQELETQQNVEFTRRRLEVLVGGPLDTLAVLDVARFVPNAPVPASVDAWIERAEQASPELASLRAQMEATRLEIEKAQAGHKPTLDLVAQWSRTNSDSVTSVNSRYDNKTIGLQLSVPLYAGGGVSSSIRQAVAAHERAREVLEAARRDLGVRVHREFRGITEGVLRIAALEQAVRSAEQAVTSNRQSFRAGMRTTLDVLNAEQQKTVALRDLAQARYVYLLSRLRLQSLAGEGREDIVAEINAWLAP
ncbi:TolC family outer membrane protein [Acidovorax sp. JG5]|uniref:TolC family outer membrane protein n=1 Tax=Acidovorax sp. JG5 TaxID=2822718 RepID=UPI001B3378CF|nr:TolC family outer membrane protein [Acidovorax sp. JG5]MBP3979805.1 TolC family outer membrane protein [Acidovorax sp. JG5]